MTYKTENKHFHEQVKLAEMDFDRLGHIETLINANQADALKKSDLIWLVQKARVGLVDAKSELYY